MIVVYSDFTTLLLKKTEYSTDDYVKKTKFSADTNALDDNIDKVDKKIPNFSNLASKSSLTVLIRDLNDTIHKIKIKDYAKKTSLSGYILTSTFNTKSTELANKISANDTKITSVKNDLSSYAKKSEVANDITTIKNDYVTNASLTSKLNDLKAQHIATEVKTIDDKTKKNASDILAFKTRLKQKEGIVDESQREISFFRGFFSYTQNSNLVYECKINSMKFDISGILQWKPKDIYDILNKNVLNSVRNMKTVSPNIKKILMVSYMFLLMVTILN